jgi:hypothetical protein
MKTSTNTLIAIWGTLLFSSCVPNNDTIVETPANDTVTPIAPIDTAVVEEDVFTPNDWDRASKMLAGIPVEHEFKIDSNYYSEYVDYITNEFTGKMTLFHKVMKKSFEKSFIRSLVGTLFTFISYIQRRLTT